MFDTVTIVCFHKFKHSPLLYVKCVSKVLGHLSKPAAPTSVPGLLRHILLSVCGPALLWQVGREPVNLRVEESRAEGRADPVAVARRHDNVRVAAEDLHRHPNVQERFLKSHIPNMII